MANAIPAVGSRISLVSSGDIRYEGILYSIDMVESKIALQQGDKDHCEQRLFVEAIFFLSFAVLIRGLWSLIASAVAAAMTRCPGLT